MKTKADIAKRRLQDNAMYPNDYEFTRTTGLGQTVMSFDDGSALIIGTGGVWTWAEFFNVKKAA